MGERIGQPALLLGRKGRVVLEHGIEEEVGEQASLDRGAPSARRRRRHAGRRQPVAPLQRVVGRVEELREDLDGAGVERKARLRGGAKLAVPAIQQLGALLLEDLANPIHPHAPVQHHSLELGHLAQLPHARRAMIVAKGNLALQARLRLPPDEHAAVPYPGRPDDLQAPSRSTRA